MYKLIKNAFGNPNSVLRISDGACIPFDPANRDFVEYQEWLKAGNTPLPPDEPTLP